MDGASLFPVTNSRTANSCFNCCDPGRYKLVFVPKLGDRYTRKQRFYWPPDSEAIELGLGQHIDNIRFELPLTGSEQVAASK